MAGLMEFEHWPIEKETHGYAYEKLFDLTD